MKIPNNAIEQWIKKPAPDVYAALIYGPDIGLVSSRATQLEASLCHNEEPNSSTFDLKRLKDEPYLLQDELQSLSLLGGKRLIKIRDQSTQIPKHLKETLSAPPTNDAFVIWCAEELSPSSSLRKFFEQTKHLAAIPCYKDDEQHIQRLITNTLNTQGYQYDRNVPLALSQKFYGDRLVILSELEKLMLYSVDTKTITESDIEDCVQDSQEIALTSICNAIADRDLPQMHRHLHTAYAEGMTAIAILRIVMQYFLKLHHVKHLVEEGRTFQDAAKQIKPPIFFKQLPTFQRHVSQWNSAGLHKLLVYMNELEILCKKNQVSPLLLLEYFTTQLAIKKAAS